MIDFESLKQIAGRKEVTNSDVARKNIIDALGIEATPLPSSNTTPTLNAGNAGRTMGRISDFKEPKRGGGIFDVPILGDFISLVDKPRSFIVSTVKEIGDIFVDDQSFSLSEWWNQGQSHIMMGEVFRDWDIGPDGMEGFFTGLIFDIALDPLTYLAGAGLAARASKADDVSKALLQVGKKAEQAGDLTKAQRMFKAEEAVTRSGSILAAGDALAELGIQSGLRFTIPATGRLGRTIIEKPLRALNPRLGKWLDTKRVGQLSPELTAARGAKGPLGFLDNILDTTDDVVQRQITKRMQDIRDNVPMAKGFDQRIDTAARIAMNMPVEAFKIPFSTGSVLARGTGALGKTWRGLYATKYGYKIADGLSTRAVFTKAKSAKTVEERLWGLYGQEIMNGADASAGTWKAYAVNEFEKLTRQVAKEGADLANILRGAEIPLYQGVDAVGNPLVNPRLLEIDSIFGTEAGIRLHKLFSDEGTGFWHRILDKWNEMLPYSGYKRTLDALKDEFYGPHFLTDEGYKAVKGVRQTDTVRAGEKAGVGGIRGSAAMGRRSRSPKSIISQLREDWGFFRTSRDFRILANKMGLRRDVGQEEFLDALGRHLNEHGEHFNYTAAQGKTRKFNNKVVGRAIKDPEFADGMDVRMQVQAYGKEVYGDDWIEIFTNNPRQIFTRYVTQMDQTFRSEYVLDAFQEAGIIVRGTNDNILRDAFGEWSDRTSQIFGIIREQTWKGTKYGSRDTGPKYRGTVKQQEDLDRIAAEINDLEQALAWLRGDPSQPLVSGAVAAKDIALARNIVTDFAMIDGIIIDLQAAIGAIMRGDISGISPRALALLQGEEIVLGMKAAPVKAGAKEAQKRAGTRVGKGLPEKVKMRVPRPQTKKPSTQKLADEFRNKKQLDAAYEEAALVVKGYSEVLFSLRYLIDNLGEQVKLVGKDTVRRTGDADVVPKNISDIRQGEDLGSLVRRATDDQATGVTPSEYLKEFQRKIEAKIRALSAMIDGVQSNLAKNIVDEDPTSVVASLINDINIAVTEPLEALGKALNNIDSGTLAYIRKSLDDLRALGPQARRSATGLPDELTDELIRIIVGVTKGTTPTAKVQAKNLPLDILEQLAVKMGPSAGGALQQWVKSVKELQKLYKQLGARLDDDLVPSLLDARAAREKLRDAVSSQTEDMLNAIIGELAYQVSKGVGSPKNRTTLAALEGWAVEMENVRQAGINFMDELDAKWSARLADAQARGADVQTLLTMKELQIADNWATIRQLRSEYDEMLSSPALKDRVRAQETAEDALKMLGDRRMHAAFSDAWSEQLQRYLIHLHQMGGANLPDSAFNISRFTKNKLKGYSLVSSSDNLTRDQIELFEAVFQASAKTFDSAAVTGFKKNYLQLVNWWKAMAISTTGFIWRNTMGGFWLNNQIAGVPLSTHTRVLGIRYVAKQAGNGDVVAGLNRLVQNGQNVTLPAGFRIGSGFNSTVNVDELRMFRDWYASGVAESGQVTQEIHSVLDTMGSMSRKEKLAKGGTWRPWKAEFYPAAGIRILNQDAEFMLRGAVAHHTMMTGGSVDDAFRQAEKFHFNYSDLTNFERNAKMVVPFWTWQKNIIPVLLESMGKNPRAWARLQQVKNELELLSDEEGVVPDFFAENMGIRTPWKWNSDRVYVLPDLPFRDMSRWLKEADSPKDIWKSPTRAMVESTLPWFKLPIELWAGKQTFANIPITGRYQQAPFWAETPVLKQVLQGMGILKENRNGQLKMRDNHIYILDQMYPFFGRIARLVPNEEGKQERHFATIINTSLGLGIRMNTDRARRGQMIKDQVEISQTFRDMRDLEYRER